MLTFAADCDLEVWSLDGSSAARITETDETDQHLILVRLPADTIYNERAQTELICKLAVNNGHDGIVRIEVSYKVTICDFSNEISLVNNVTIPRTDSLLSLPENSTESNDTEYNSLPKMTDVEKIESSWNTKDFKYL